MAGDDLQKPLQPLSPVLDHIVTEPVGKHFPRQRRDRHPCALPLEDVAEILEIRIAAVNDGLAGLEGRDVGPRVDLVARVHVPGGAVSYGVFDLVFRRLEGVG